MKSDTFVPCTPDDVTPDLLDSWETEAGTNGDFEMVEIVRRARKGDEDAIKEVARCTTESRAMRD